MAAGELAVGSGAEPWHLERARGTRAKRSVLARIEVRAPANAARQTLFERRWLLIARHQDVGGRAPPWRVGRGFSPSSPTARAWTRSLSMRQLLEVSQRHAVAPACRKVADGPDHAAVLLGADHEIRVPESSGDIDQARSGGMVTQRHQPAPVVVACQVEHDRSEIRGRPIVRSRSGRRGGRSAGTPLGRGPRRHCGRRRRVVPAGPANGLRWGTGRRRAPRHRR